MAEPGDLRQTRALARKAPLSVTALASFGLFLHPDLLTRWGSRITGVLQMASTVSGRTGDPRVRDPRVCDRDRAAPPTGDVRARDAAA